MKFLYVDESGDAGLAATSPVQHFLLAGLIIDTADWQGLLTSLHDFRQHLAAKYGLLLSEEIHASAFVSKPAAVGRIPLNDRLRILLECVDWCRRSDLRLLTVGMDKRQALTDTVFQDVWRQLLLRFDHYLAIAGPTGPTQGLVFCDNTDGTKLTALMRSLQNLGGGPATRPAPLLHHLIGDPVLWESRTSYLHQMVDVIAYFAKQLVEPNRRIRSKGAHRYFLRLARINLLVGEMPQGIWLL